MHGNPGDFPPPPWDPDCGDGTYRNPVLHADYSDPDAVRVGGDYFLTASSFQCAPGLPILHSTDLVRWRLIGHALARQVPEAYFSIARPGQGVWAPALRHHGGVFHLYYPDPDHGIHRVSAVDAAGPWSEPVLVLGGRGLIDPCPLWAADGRVWLVHAWARSRAGFNNRLTLVELDADGLRPLGEARLLIEGGQVPGCHTLEGPKFHVRGPFIYVLAPAGGVATGWQSVFRARSLEGPWEHRIVLEQGPTPVNGPHQGALVDTPDGESWFLHFQDRGAFGRVVHLQPVVWRDHWPLMGTEADRCLSAGPGDEPPGSRVGNPVLRHRRPRAQAWGAAAQPGHILLPNVPPSHASCAGAEGPAGAVPATTDDFAAGRFGLQWQWQANPRPSWHLPGAHGGRLSLACVEAPSPEAGGLGLAPNLLLQKFPAPTFTATTSLRLLAARPGAFAGLMVSGEQWAWLGLEAGQRGLRVVWASSQGEGRVARGRPEDGEVGLRVAVSEDGLCRFFFSARGAPFQALGEAFAAVPGKWIGAKVGLFAAVSSTPTSTRPAPSPVGAPSAGESSATAGVASFGPFVVAGA